MHSQPTTSTPSTRWTVLALLGLAFNAWAGTPPPNMEELRARHDRIDRVERGLLDPVVVQGEAPRTATLSERMRALHVPALSIAVINDGRIEWERAYGEADVRTGQRVTTHTLFQVASISKPVTAVMAMRLAQAGRLDLDADVNRQLSGWQVRQAPGGAPVAVAPRALLSHTAGLPTYDLTGYDKARPLPTVMQVLQGMAPANNPRAEVDVSAAGHYAYSGLGYVVLQHYLSSTIAQPFDSLANELVFQPLGMRDSRFGVTLPRALADRAACGHGLDGAALERCWRRYPELAAAGLWTTASDLARFVIAVQRASQGRSQAFLSQALATQMLTPVDDGYGLGFELDTQGAQPAFFHSGSNEGYKALLFAYPRSGQGVVILTNGDQGGPLIDALMRSLAAEYHWPHHQPVVRAAVPAQPALYDRFVGSFSVGNVTLQVTRKDDRLYLAGPPLGEHVVELLPMGAHEFFMREKDATLRFEPNGDKPVESITFVDGRPRPGKRVPAALAHSVAS